LAALIILLTLLLALGRVLVGPTAVRRLLGTQAFGTAGTAVLALLALAFSSPVYLDIALVLALLAAVSVITFTQSVRIGRARRKKQNDLA
jgi:multicomponent Na+:H+ antiporter subunit F